MMLRPGDRVPDLPLLGPDGARRSLRDFEGEATALIFLRHLG
jgi:peroxiredoxin